jgi:myb proto-oncogene protein
MVRVAVMVPGRSYLQCVNRWGKYLDPTPITTARAGKWTTEEDTALTDAVKEHGDNKWGTVAALVLGRTRSQCCQRWGKSLDPHDISLGYWTAEEDAKLYHGTEIR